MNNLTVVKSNKVVEAGYKLTLMEQLILLSCIAQIDSRKELSPEMRFEISVSDLLNIKKTETKNEYRDLKIASERLLSRIVTINNPYPNESKVTQLKTQWISYVEYIPDDGKIRLGFAAKIIPYLSQISREFTRYQLEHVGNMNSTYGIRLYELIMQWKDMEKREIAIDWLKKQFQIEDKYSAIKDLKKYVIDPAVKDINDHSNYAVSWEQRKTGRRVTHLIFTFAEKKAAPEKPKKTQKTEPMIYGVSKSEIDRLARPGESYEAAAARIKKAKEGKPR